MTSFNFYRSTQIPISGERKVEGEEKKIVEDPLPTCFGPIRRGW